MEKGKQQGAMMVLPKGLPLQLQNPIHEIQTRFKQLESCFKLWLSKQSLPVEATVVTATNAAQGAAIVAFMGMLTSDASSVFPTPPLNPQAMASFKQAQSFFPE